jgi:hypothetical protein
MTNAPNQVSLVGLAFGSTAVIYSHQELYEQWLAGFEVGSDTNTSDDADGDLIDNLTEYAWDGEPDNPLSRGHVPAHSMVADGGTDYLTYVHYERDDAADRGLVSHIEASTDLMISAGWSTNDVEAVGSGPAAGIPDFTAVTNRIPTDAADEQFIRVQIEMLP